MEKKLPILCPSCGSDLKVQSLKCCECDTSISGQYDLPVLLKLEAKEQEFILNFVKSSGSLKLMASQLGLSYPTVRNMLDDLISTIQKLQNNDQKTL